MMYQIETLEREQVLTAQQVLKYCQETLVLKKAQTKTQREKSYVADLDTSSVSTKDSTDEEWDVHKQLI